MIVYQSTKEGFQADVLSNEISEKIHHEFFLHLGRHTSPNEVLSWKNSMEQMNKVLSDSEIPNNVGVSIEYQVPLTSKRIDFIITGIDSSNLENAVIIELKQWSSAKLTNKDAIIKTRFQSGEHDTAHPSYQAWSYASTLYNFNENVQQNNIILTPCAFLHNYNPDGIIDNPFYDYYIKKAPIFFKSDIIKLRTFIKQYVKYGDNKDIIYKIENGRIKPSKYLADSIASMLKGNQEFIMLDDQKDVFETALLMSNKASSSRKQVLIVEGGPGTGKSVVAINLLAAFQEKGYASKYVSKNSAPREVYSYKLSGTMRQTDISNLFSGSGAFIDSPKDLFDVLIVDEAHRLNLKSGLFYKGDNQIKEIINAAKLSIFFIDNDQRIHIKDIGSSEYIKAIANEYKAEIVSMKLESQFRCNGSDGYLAWLDNTLQIRDTANFRLSQDDFDFQIFDDPVKLFETIKWKNKNNNRSRMVAGYCWDWISRKDNSKFDVIISDFKMQWNLNEDGSRWIIGSNSINQIGCIHTCQGLELDYVGVIIGPDISYKNGKVVTNFSNRSSHDKSISGMKVMQRNNPQKAVEESNMIIKNTYRTLLTRGMKGCYVYFCDKALEEHFRSQLEPNSIIPKLEIKPKPTIRIEKDVNDDAKYIDFLPYFSLKAACGYFGSAENVDEEGWVLVDGIGRIDKRMFVVKASGNSMEPKISDGDFCVFKSNIVGSRKGKIVLAQCNEYDSDYDGSYTIKQYDSKVLIDKETGTWEHEEIVLRPLNNEYKPIIINEEDDGSYAIIAEFILNISKSRY